MSDASLLSGLFTPALALRAAGKAYALAVQTEPGKQILRQVATRYEAAKGDAPANHDLEQALRLAGLTACLLLISQYRSEWEPEYATERVTEPPFLDAAETWAYAQVDCCPLVAKTPDHALIEAMHAALDAMLPASRAADIEAALGEVRQAAWDEMIAGAGDHAPPEFFEARFFGISGDGAKEGPDWGAVYRALVQEALKDNARAETAFITSRLAGVRNDLQSVLQRLNDIAATGARTEVNTDRLLDGQAAADSKLDAILGQLAAKAGVPEEPLRKVLERLGAEHVPVAEIPKALASAADELVALRAQLARMPNDDRPEFRAIREAAQVHIDAGDFARARAALQRGREAARDLRRQADMAEAQFLSAEARVDLLEQRSVAARDKFAEAATLNPDNCWLWFATGDLWIDTGNSGEALAAYQQGKSAAERSGDDRDLSIATNKIGEIFATQGNLTEALDAFRASHDIFERLAKADPQNAEWQRDLSVSHNKIGDVLVAQGNLADALAAFRASLDIRERLATADPQNSEWQRDLSVSHIKIGDVLVAQGNLTEALAAFRADLAIAERLAKADPQNSGWQRDLSVSHNKIGDMLVAQGNLTEALAAFRASHDIFERLAKADPQNSGWQRDLSVSHNKMGDVLVAQGNLTEALDAFRASLDIAERLAKADPQNAEWQRDLSVSQDRIGDVLVAQGNLTEALAAFRASLDIAERLAKADPQNAGWQRDLSVSHNKMGDVLVAQGNLTEALAAFRASLDIRERLAKADPQNSGWQRDLAVSYFKTGLAEEQGGDIQAAIKSFEAGRAILAALVERAPDFEQWRQDLANSERDLARLRAAGG